MINLFEENQSLKTRNEEVVIGTVVGVPIAVILIVLLLYPTVAY